MSKTTQLYRVDRFASTTGFWFFLLLIFFALRFGWSNQNDPLWIAEYGIGYALGIIGGVMMLLLLLYPLRKRIKAMGNWLPVRYWFRMHMLFGALGPALVLLHSNFQLGSINSRIALFSMLLVAGSGFIGRYFYRKIHKGLYGRHLDFNEMKSDSELLDRKLGALLKLSPSTFERLQGFEQKVFTVSPNPLGSFGNWIFIRIYATHFYRSIIRELHHLLKKQAQKSNWDAEKSRKYEKTVHITLTNHKTLLVRILEFHFYERLFAIWHLLHLPLFIMMIITGFIHVYAVHVY